MIEGCACQCSGGMQILTLLPSSPTGAQAGLLPGHPGRYRVAVGPALDSLSDVLGKWEFAGWEGLRTYMMG